MLSSNSLKPVNHFPRTIKHVFRNRQRANISILESSESSAMIAVYENNDRLSLRFHSLAESRDLQPLSRLPEDFLADILGTVRSFPPYSTPHPLLKGKRETREERRGNHSGFIRMPAEMPKDYMMRCPPPPPIVVVLAWYRRKERRDLAGSRDGSLMQ